MSFDPSRHMMNLKGKDYLPVAARIAWFREEHPDWSIITEPHTLTDDAAIYRTTIVDASSKIIATATKAEDRRGFADFLEKAECVPLDTEILTRDGWKRYDHLVIGELVLSYDVQTDSSAWVPVERIATYEDARVCRIFNGWGFDAICTPEHKWATRSESSWKGKRYEYFRLCETNRLNTGLRIVTGCPAPEEDAEISVTPKEAAIFGWLMTDGRFRSNDGHFKPIIYQSKKRYIAEITELLTDVPHRLSSRPAGKQTILGRECDCMESFRWSLPAQYLHGLLAKFGVSAEWEIGRTIPKISRAARLAMLDAMMKADGTDRGEFGKKRKPWVMPVYQLLAAIEGHSLGRYCRSSKGDVPIQRLKKTRHTYCSHLKYESAGKTDVWCPTTKYGTWYARFSNGFTTITGNTGSVGRALALCGYGTLQAMEFDETPRIVDSPQQPRNDQRPAQIATAPRPDEKNELAEARVEWRDVCGEASIDDARARGELLNLLLGRARNATQGVSAADYLRACELLETQGIPSGFFDVEPVGSAGYVDPRRLGALRDSALRDVVLSEGPESPREKTAMPEVKWSPLTEPAGEAPGELFGPDEGLAPVPATATSAIAGGL